MECKIYVMGDKGVGKTSLTIQFIHNLFLNTYDPTMEDTYQKQRTIDDENSLLKIFDTPGVDSSAFPTPDYINLSHGFLLVYSITNRNSFNKIIEYYEEILRLKARKKIPIIIIGNKSDLEISERKVTSTEGKELANKINCLFYETSAKINVDEIFCQIVREIKNDFFLSTRIGNSFSHL